MDHHKANVNATSVAYCIYRKSFKAILFLAFILFFPFSANLKFEKLSEDEKTQE